MLIRTKIIATIGPACATPDAIIDLAAAGCDVFRINFSHGTHEDQDKLYKAVREAEARWGKPLAILGDLCGPKIRVGDVEKGTVLEAGKTIEITRESVLGTASRISTNLAELIDEAKVGERLLLDDGKLQLRVEKKLENSLMCTVVIGGPLSSHKGLNLPDTDLSLSAITEKDRKDVVFMGARDFDYVALSFVRTAEEIRTLKTLLHESGSHADVMAKIEKPQAVKNIEEIIEATDAIMVARGDLGVEMDLTEVPVAQKKITALCQQKGKPCVIATQMLESMTSAATPTRAEVSDVANAVLDLADAVMLSGETSVGINPAHTVATMNAIVAQMQAYHDKTAKPCRVENSEIPVTAALANSVHALCECLDLSAVCVWTNTGETARLLAKTRIPRPIVALSCDLTTVRKMCLCYGVESRLASHVPTHTRELFTLFENVGEELEIFTAAGDRYALLSGRPLDAPGQTNNLAVCTYSPKA